MQKPGFSVLSLVCCLLAVFGVALTKLRTMLPKQSANQLQSESDEFLVQGAYQQVNWKLLEPNTLAEARRLHRPVMLVMGTVWSRDGRRADERIFTDADVQSYLQRNFVCARLDLDAHPEWRSAFLPVSRGIAGVQSAFQIFYLDTQGKVYDFYGRGGLGSLTDPTTFIDEFVRAKRSFDALDSALQPSPGSLQNDDIAVLRDTASGVPAVSRYLGSLEKEIDPTYGGFDAGGGQTPRPSALLALLYGGEIGAVKTSVDPMLRSAWVDWLDGGFFRRTRKVDWSDIDFDKVAVSTAEMMRVLALYANFQNDRFAERIAKNAFDALAGPFSETGLVATARVGDESDFERSARSSFAAKDLRSTWGTGLLEPKDADSARRLFGLVVETNPQMCVRVRDPEAFADPSFERILEILRKSKQGVPQRYTTHPMASTNGTATALMYTCARLWNDPARMAQANERFDALSTFGNGDDVSHGQGQSLTDQPYLGDYLAVADACLSRFLAEGDLRSLDRADRVMRRAEILFTNNLGWSAMLAKTAPVAPDVSVPEVLDTPTESLTAKVIRLENTLGRLLRGGGRKGHDPVEIATELAMKYGAFMHQLGAPAAGYFAASIPVLEDGHAFTVGPKAIPLSAELFRLVPTRLVAPAIGPVRLDLQKRAPGIYVVRGADVRGPMDASTAAEVLGWAYRTPDPMP